MATVLDALVITLGLDTAGFRKGQREATDGLRRTKEEARNTARDMEDSGKRGSDFYSRLRREALAFFTAYAGYRAFQSALGREASASDASVGRLSRSLGIATDRLSAFQGMAERVGGTREGLNGSFQSIQSQIENFRLLGTPINGVFRSLGIHLADDTGQQRPVDDIYKDSIRALRSRPEGERPTLAREMGYGQEAVGFAAMPEREFNRLFDEQRRLGTVTDQQAAAGQKLLEMWLNLSQAFDSMWRHIRGALVPGLQAFLGGIEKFVTWLTNESKPLLDQVNAALKAMGDYLGSAEFRNDLSAFGRGIHDIAQAIVRALRFFGLIPDPNEKKKEGEDGQAGVPANERPVGGVQGGIWRLRSQILGAVGINVPSSPPGNGPQVEPGRRRTPEEFAQEFGPMANRAAAQLQVSPRIILGQMAIESDWGRAFTGRNNPFNLTAAPGADATAGADRDGQGRSITQRFQNFPTAEAAADHYAARVRRLWPDAVGAGDDAARFSAGLRFGQQGGYATDPDGGYATWLARRARQIPMPPAAPPIPPPQVPRDAEGNEQPMQNPTIGRQSYLDPALLTGARFAMAASERGGAVSNSTSSSETHVGQVVINTQATDAGGIARDFGQKLRDFSMVDQATRGLA